MFVNELGGKVNFYFTTFSFLLGMLVSCCVFCAGGAYSGPALTTGPTSSHFYLGGATINPAMPSLLVDQDENWRFSYFPSGLASIEFGNVDDFVDEIDDLIDFVNESDILNQNLNENLDRFNGIIGELSEDGYIKTDFRIHGPLLPLAHASEFLNGAISVDFTYGVQATARLFDSPIVIDLNSLSVTTDTSLYLKSGVEAKLSFSYSQDISKDLEWFPEGQSFYAGAKVNLISLGLSRQIIPLISLGDRGVGDVIIDEYNDNLKNSVEFAFDMGFVFDAEKYRLGFIVENLNSPKFEYGALGQNCNESSPGLLRDSCLAAQFFAVQGRIQTAEYFTLEPRARVDALYKIHNNLHISTALDLHEYADVTGFDNRWFYVSSSYNTSYYFLPSVRFGYQKNLVDAGTSSINFGVSIFKFLNIDIEYGLETVTVETDEWPRRLGLAISIEEHF